MRKRKESKIIFGLGPKQLDNATLTSRGKVRSMFVQWVLNKLFSFKRLSLRCLLHVGEDMLMRTFIFK